MNVAVVAACRAYRPLTSFSLKECYLIVHRPERHSSGSLTHVSLGREIRRRRKALGWTLEDLAHWSGLSAHYLSNLENDDRQQRRDPSLSTINAIAKALGADAPDLLGGHRVLTGAGLEAGKRFQSLSPDAQQAVLHLMRLLARKRR